MIGKDRDAVTHAIRDARKRAGLTQEQAAALTGHATSTISRWETGGLPSTWHDLAHYAHTLNQSIVVQFGPDTEEALPPPWAEGLEERLTKLLLANRAVFEMRAKELAEYALAQEPELPPPDAPSPGTAEGMPEPAARQRGR